MASYALHLLFMDRWHRLLLLEDMEEKPDGRDQHEHADQRRDEERQQRLGWAGGICQRQVGRDNVGQLRQSPRAEKGTCFQDDEDTRQTSSA